MSHSACTHRSWVDSRLLMVGSQTANLTPGTSFTHNLYCRCLNGPCEAIFGIYASRPFQKYKEHFKARCFDPYNRILSFQESQRTPKSPFRECECHPHTPSKWGCDNTLLLLHHCFEIQKVLKFFTFVFHEVAPHLPCVVINEPHIVLASSN